MNDKNWCLVCGVRIDTGQVYCERHGGAPKQPSLSELIKTEFSQMKKYNMGKLWKRFLDWISGTYNVYLDDEAKQLAEKETENDKKDESVLTAALFRAFVAGYDFAKTKRR
jgi:hypothetical protein